MCGADAGSPGGTKYKAPFKFIGTPLLHDCGRKRRGQRHRSRDARAHVEAVDTPGPAVDSGLPVTENLLEPAAHLEHLSEGNAI
jgi:hypothetical protein